MSRSAERVRSLVSAACRQRTVVAAALILVLAMGGCAAIQNKKAIQTERLLAAAGFQMKLADTPDKLARLQEKPQRVLAPVNKDGTVYYLYADATSCECLYIGSEEAYQRYQKIVVQRNIAEDQRMAAQMNQNAAMDWGMWGPWGPWW